MDVDNWDQPDLFDGETFDEDDRVILEHQCREPGAPGVVAEQA